jgi:cytochrome P450
MTSAEMAIAESAALRLDVEEADPLPLLRPAASVGTLRLLRAFRSDLLAAFSADAYSQLRVSFRRLGRRFIVLSDPDDINHVLNTHLDRYQPNVLAHRLLEPIVGRGLVLAEGEEWERQHRQLIPVFQPRHIERLVPAFHVTAAGHVASWSDGRVAERNLLIDFRRLTLAVIARSMLSIDDETRTAQLADFASQAESAGALLRWQDYVALLAWKNIGQPAERLDVGVRWRGWVGTLLDQRPPIDDVEQARDMLDLLRSACDAATGAALPRDLIVDQIGTMLAAGFATTALGLYWTALMLALFPAHQDAVRHELCQGPRDEPPDFQALRASRVATAFLYESLRLYPPAYVIARQARLDDQIGDFHIPRGAAVIIAPWLVHRHEALWEHPNRFDPNRFLQGGRITLPKAWMAFGSGPRVCIGAAFATMEILVILRCLLGRYRIALVDLPPSAVGRVTLLPDTQPLFRLTPL